MAMIDANKKTESELLSQVQQARVTGTSVGAVLKTDERVFARITDGIYREPASALRELIANAYDADATVVRVETDAPRFSQITVRDNGHGLTEEALVHVICHIGGSLKRTTKGRDFNVVSAVDSSLSPAGRKLIGKLGIGLFSVSQLTHHLTIVTKVRGENVRRVCDILLMPQRDDASQSGDGEDKFVTGKVLISTVPALDVESYGTEITLLDIRPYVRESLQSQALWASIGAEPTLTVEDSVSEIVDLRYPEVESDGMSEEDDDFLPQPSVPVFHIGRVSNIDAEVLVDPPIFPWEVDDSPSIRFEKLVHGVQRLDTGSLLAEKIKLTDVLDTYFRTIWTLSLSVPVSYLQKHPFSLVGDDQTASYALSNKSVRPSATQIALAPDQTIRQACGFVTPDSPTVTEFQVIFDGVELKRPLDFPSYHQPLSSNIKPLLFVGKIKSDMSSLPAEYSGGPIEVEAYFYWQPRVVPAEHNGIMVRINGASGIMFDEQFFKYQVSEQTRLKQITAEIFIVRGLDAALNIDRESFNVAHPHYQYVRKWVHHSLRQVVSKHKSLTKGTRDLGLEGGLQQAVESLSAIVSEGHSSATRLTDIIFANSAPILASLTADLIFDRNVVMSPRAGLRPKTKGDRLKESLLEEQIRAVAAVLNGIEAFRALDSESRDELLRKIVAIFTVQIK
jgi:hypothetical protein